jgi:hypothetical protein
MNNTERAALRRACVSIAFLIALASTFTVRAAEMAAFEIVARDGRLYPEQLAVPAFVKLRLTIRNEGNTAVEIENLDLRVEKIVAPSSAAVVIVQALKPGRYPLFDEFNPESGRMVLIAR